MPTLRMGESDIPLIDHLVMREFVSGPPIYRCIHKTVRDRKPSLRESWWAVCGFRTEFFEKRQFFWSCFLFKLLVFEEHSPFVEIMHMLHVYCHRRWRRSPRQVSACTARSMEAETRNGHRNAKRNPYRNHETIVLCHFSLKDWKRDVEWKFLDSD